MAKPGGFRPTIVPRDDRDDAEDDITFPNIKKERDAADDLINNFIKEPEPKKGELPSLKWLMEQFKTKSGVIRYLTRLGYAHKIIANHLNIRTQHVRNVQTQELKRGPTELYVETAFVCSHEKTASAFVDVILRRSIKDTNQSRILYRVCSDCAKGVIPGVTDDAIAKHLPGLEDNDE